MAQRSLLRIYLARHGQTDWNLAKRVQGATDVPLNATGEAQARALADMMMGAQLDHVFCSDLQRSRGTAKAFVGRATITALPELNEQKLGKFEGKLLDGSDPKLVEEYERRTADPDDTLDGGESENQHAARVKSALATIRSRFPSGNILIIGHGGTNAQLLRAVFDLSREETDNIHQANDEIYQLELTSGRPPVIWKRIPRSLFNEL